MKIQEEDSIWWREHLGFMLDNQLGMIAGDTMMSPIWSCLDDKLGNQLL